MTKNVERNYWEVQFYYKDWQGIQRKKHKRGFKTKKEAIAWVEQFKLQQARNLDMKFSSFVEIYFADMEQRLRENTIRSKRYIVELKILPYFKEKKVAEITAADVRKWQNILMDKKNGYSQTYLKTINNQLSAIMNYAVNYYDLPRN
ncbi:MAG: Arm DNA-binding domain-containing protein, partial [Eubacteriales bacterium]|nr:Arm DNA-binding domain-containing protein [Eubacteriales bacterium]